MRFLFRSVFCEAECPCAFTPFLPGVGCYSFVLRSRVMLRASAVAITVVWTLVVMVIVNPAAGNGGGKRVYERDVEPVLRCALGEIDGHRSASRLDVVVTENLFGDILSDLGPAVAGSIGIAPAANLNPPGDFPSLFEPVHGSAPDIAGQGIANPVAAVWTAALMLDHLGESGAAAELEAAIETVLENPDARTRDLGGKADTRTCGEAILRALV